MRWLPRNPKPKLGDKRVVVRFAFWPTQVGSHKIWFEKYGEIQTYVELVRWTGWVSYVSDPRLLYEEIPTWREENERKNSETC